MPRKRTITPPPEIVTLDDLRADGATISVQRAARALGLSDQTAYRMVGTGEIPSVKLGRQHRVPTETIIRMIEGAGADVPA